MEKIKKIEDDRNTRHIREAEELQLLRDKENMRKRERITASLEESK